jgi:hypothetical protein
MMEWLGFTMEEVEEYEREVGSRNADRGSEDK